MGPALRGAAVIQGGQGRPPLQSRTRTAQNGTSGTASPTHSVIARSEATRQSVLPSPKRRIPAPVTRSLARNDSAARWERRDTWVPPYGVRRSSRAGRGVRPYKAKQEPRKTGRWGRRALHTLSLRGAKRRGNPFSSAQRDGFPCQCVPQGHLLRGAHWLGMTARRAGNGGTHGSRPTGCGGHPGRTESSAPTKQNKNRAKRGAAVIQDGRRRPPLQGRTGTAQNGTAGTAYPTNRRGAAGTAKFRNFFFPLSASAGLRRLYSDDTGRPPVL